MSTDNKLPSYNDIDNFTKLVKKEKQKHRKSYDMYHHFWKVNNINGLDN